MIPSDPRPDATIFADETTNRGCNATSQRGNENIENYSGILWCDNAIDHDDYQRQHTLSHLSTVSKHVQTFTDYNKCSQYIDELDEAKEFFLIVSGSLGINFIPKICQNPKVRSIYIFCRAISKYQTWAKDYSKINGVFDQITQLIQVLRKDKQQVESEKLPLLIMGHVENLAPWSSNSDQFVKIKNPTNNEEELKIHNGKKSNISFQVSSNQELDSGSNIACSNTVTPCTLQKEQTELPDILPCVCVITDNRDELIHPLQSVIGTIHYFNSMDHFSEHLKNHPIDPHIIIISNPDCIGYVNRLATYRQIRKLYIHCSDNRLAEYDKWRDRYPELICVLQHLDSLYRSILWDLSACFVDIGDYYTKQNRRDLALKRYECAHSLIHTIQNVLNGRSGMIECYQLSKLTD